jgi:integrase
MTNHLELRGNVYYFRRKIPNDLVQHFGRKQIMFSLKTRDYAQAKQLAPTHTVLTDAEFSAARALKDGKKPASTVVRPMDEGMADVFLHEEGWQTEYEAHKEWPDARDAGAQAEREFTDAILSSAGLPSASQMEFFLSEGGFRPDDLPTPKQQALAIAMRRAADAAEISQAGRPTVRQVVLPASQIDCETLRHVIPAWIARNAPKENAVGRTNKALELFEQAVGVIPLRQLTKADGAKFVRFLLDEAARGFKRKTASNHAAAITALLRVAVKEDLIERNLLDLTFDKTIGAETRTPWTDAELELMYGHALFSDHMNDVPEWQDVKPTDGRALLLILQHTGARIGEVAQLRRSDFHMRDGMTVIHITAAAGTVKTAESERSVPLANHLLDDAWFSAWLEGVMDGEHADRPAFPSMAGRERGPGDTAVQWFRAFRDVVGLPSGPLHGSHKFRHWIRTAMNALDVAEATQDAITGHTAGGSTGTKVYTHVPLPVMLAALNRIAYPQRSLV